MQTRGVCSFTGFSNLTISIHISISKLRVCYQLTIHWFGEANNSQVPRKDVKGFLALFAMPWSQKDFAHTFSKTITITAKEKLSHTPGNCRCPADVSTVCDTCDSMSCDPPTIQRRLGISTPLKDIWPVWNLDGCKMTLAHGKSALLTPSEHLKLWSMWTILGPHLHPQKMTPEMMLAPHILYLSFFQGGY